MSNIDHVFTEKKYTLKIELKGHEKFYYIFIKYSYPCLIDCLYSQDVKLSMSTDYIQSNTI